jgi:hypothetical protein
MDLWIIKSKYFGQDYHLIQSANATTRTMWNLNDARIEKKELGKSLETKSTSIWKYFSSMKHSNLQRNC